MRTARTAPAFALALLASTALPLGAVAQTATATGSTGGTAAAPMTRPSTASPEAASGAAAKPSIDQTGQGALPFDVSRDAALGLREVQFARLALMQGDGASASRLVADAQARFKAAEPQAVMVNPADMPSGGAHASSGTQSAKPATGTEMAGNGASSTTGTTASRTGTEMASADHGRAGEQAYFPIGAQVALAESFSEQNPSKTGAASAQPKTGTAQETASNSASTAPESLKLNELDVAVAVALLPQQSTVDTLAKVAQLIKDQKLPEAATQLASIEQGVIVREAEAIGTPKADTQSTASAATPAHTPANKMPAQSGTATEQTPAQTPASN